LPEISAGWIVSGAADPAVSGKDHGRNFCAYGIGDIATAKSAAADGISRAAAAIAIARIIARAVIVTPAVETVAAIVTVAVTDKETTGATAAAVERGEAAMKAAAVETSSVGATAEAASRISGSGEEDHKKRETNP
jgi:hypothetical protein